MKIFRVNLSLGILDVFMNGMAYFLMLFFIAWLNINPESQEQKVDQRAEMFVKMSWSGDNPHDVDLWMKGPLGHIVCFHDKQESLMHLDRDDRGIFNDAITVGGEEIRVEENREMISIRGIIQGEYQVSVHLWGLHNDDEYEESYYDNEGNFIEPQDRNKDNDPQEPIEVTIELWDVNPSMQLMEKRIVALEHKKQEKTAFRFRVNRDGKITDINHKKVVIANSISGGANR